MQTYTATSTHKHSCYYAKQHSFSFSVPLHVSLHGELSTRVAGAELTNIEAGYAAARQQQDTSFMIQTRF